MILRSEKVKMDSGVKAITAFCSLLFVAVGIGLPVYCIFTAESNAEIIANVVLILFILLCLIPVFMLAPKKVILYEDSLMVKKMCGTLVLPINEISGVELFEKDLPGIRTFGSGGFLGYLGKFYSKKLGHYTAYVGDCSKSFFITMKNGKKYLLSCDNHRGMVEKIDGMLLA